LLQAERVFREMVDGHLLSSATNRRQPEAFVWSVGDQKSTSDILSRPIMSKPFCMRHFSTSGGILNSLQYTVQLYVHKEFRS
jgi:hypothetical protein